MSFCSKWVFPRTAFAEGLFFFIVSFCWNYFFESKWVFAQMKFAHRVSFFRIFFRVSYFFGESEFSLRTVVLSIPSLMMGIVCTPKSLNKWPLWSSFRARFHLILFSSLQSDFYKAQTGAKIHFCKEKKRKNKRFVEFQIIREGTEIAPVIDVEETEHSTESSFWF